MKIKTSDAIGSVLDWIVATLEDCEFLFWDAPRGEVTYSPSTIQKDGQQIIREKDIQVWYDNPSKLWYATMGFRMAQPDAKEYPKSETQLVAAMRCYVSSVLGDEFDIPDAYYDAIVTTPLEIENRRLNERIAELEKLSVTNIMIAIVPGDGSGHEVYAESVDDVEKLLSRLSEKAEDYDLETIPLRNMIAHHKEKNSKQHNAVRNVLKHHKLITVGDGVIEADLIYAVLDNLSEK